VGSYADRPKTPCFISKSVNRAADPGRATVKDMRIDHRSLHVAMAQKFLDGSNVIAILKRMVTKEWEERRASRRQSKILGFCGGAGAIRGYRLTTFERVGMGLASGIGCPPLVGTSGDYHQFFTKVKFLKDLLDHLIPALPVLEATRCICLHHRNPQR
jgi:hypothetical protein